MAKKDWVSCKVSAGMAKSIDEFLEMDVAKKNGIFSRTDFLMAILRLWFSHYEKDFDFFVSHDVFETTIKEWKSKEKPLYYKEALKHLQHSLATRNEKELLVFDILLTMWDKHKEIENRPIDLMWNKVSDFIHNDLKSRYEKTLEPLLVNAPNRQKQKQE